MRYRIPDVTLCLFSGPPVPDQWILKKKKLLQNTGIEIHIFSGIMNPLSNGNSQIMMKLQASFNLFLVVLL